MKQLFAVVECADESGGLPAPIGSIVEVVLNDDFTLDNFIHARTEDWVLVKGSQGKRILARKLQLKDFWVA